jgi:hypothetical protein
MLNNRSYWQILITPFGIFKLFLYMKPKNQFTEMNNVFIFQKYPAGWNLAMLFYTKKLVSLHEHFFTFENWIHSSWSGNIAF